MPILERTKPGKTRKKPSAKEHPSSYGGREEKRQRDKHDEKFNYGGRDHRPDEDVNPAEELAEERGVDSVAEAEEPFASRLPGRAFRRGDLFAED
ncbi:MAG: hypothetical protein RIE56_08215 [Amphiplicatus sp.]